MASQTVSGAVVGQGYNEGNDVVITATLTSALSSGQTLDIQLPDAVPPDLVPVWFRAYSGATPAVELSGAAEANLRITNHNRSTGLTRLTGAGAGVADGAKVVIGYRPCR